jgi:hypothetical protein
MARHGPVQEKVSAVAVVTEHLATDTHMVRIGDVAITRSALHVSWFTCEQMQNKVKGGKDDEEQLFEETEVGSFLRH